MSGPFTTGQAGPDAVANLQMLWDRVMATVTLVDAPSVAIDISQAARSFDWTLGGNRIVTFTGGAVALGHASLASLHRKQMVLCPIQDATGGRTLTFSTGARFGSDIVTVILSTTALKGDRIALMYDHIAGKVDIVGVTHGF